MHEFYKKALVGCFCLIAACVLLGYICVKQSYLQVSLLPAADSPLAWKGEQSWDTRPGGKATMHLYEAAQRLRFDFRLARTDEGFAGAELNFIDSKGQPVHLDLSRYSSISLLVKCAPANTLVLTIPTFVGRRSDQQEFLGYRTPLSYFSCDENESRVELDLTRLETPQWWFLLAQQALSKHAYKLDKVPKIVIGGTPQSPREVSLEVQIRELNLKGRDRSYLVLLGVLLIVVWSGFGVWFFRQHAQAVINDVKVKLQKDMPFVAYQQLSLEPHRDKEKMAILQFIASHYAEAELDLDRVVEETGVNRNKVYEILKTEFGYTFSGYLNKLRLTEAARLLAEKDTATVAEIAYSVGYANVSYFNKLFKEEYGCTPKAFRSACPVAEA
ncbi:helix-turn-helix domain-containing protein [Rugamonas sp. FT81W]|uniref:Helix-turn-helix domain-containing protein n=1 Tax=Duganella vulcania TaxID=2692166 RepID=A0A845GKC6_9BURK|nr:helix-turn-helix domain-containing protein [Duganella vulcania]